MNHCIRGGLWLAVALLAAALGAGCASIPRGSERHQLRATQELQLERTAASARVEANVWPAEDWWTSFGDPRLNSLESEALAANPTLQLAQVRLQHARALAEVSRASLLPEVDAAVSSSRERFSSHDVVPPPFAGTTQTPSRLRLDFGYELDFWGKNRAALAAALDRAEAARVDEFAARLLLSTAVARAYVQLGRLNEYLHVARDTLLQRQHVYELTQQRVAAGLDTRVELRQAEGRVPAAREDIAALEESIDVTRHQLAVLLGQGPDRGLSIEPPTLQAASLSAPVLPSRLPADLLGRRPDVVASRLRVEATSYEVSVARARFYPDIDLLGFVGLQSIRLSDFLDAGSRVAGLGPALHLPVFEGGRLRGELAARRADYDAAVEQYNSTLIEALRELADQLAAFKSIAAQREQEDLAMAAASSAYELAVQRYREGMGNYLSVLSAETDVLQQRQLEADLRARDLDARIGLVRALGGGFEEGRGDR